MFKAVDHKDETPKRDFESLIYDIRSKILPKIVLPKSVEQAVLMRMGVSMNGDKEAVEKRNDHC
ncbi:MAG: hypothetical protein DRN20_01595 [Thermoplasmata archaeon]|nr:MAG: hypothetical protein DRN20_01595 [Thermoplasmata archaeon]